MLESIKTRLNCDWVDGEWVASEKPEDANAIEYTYPPLEILNWLASFMGISGVDEEIQRLRPLDEQYNQFCDRPPAGEWNEARILELLTDLKPESTLSSIENRYELCHASLWGTANWQSLTQNIEIELVIDLPYMLEFIDRIYITSEDLFELVKRAKTQKITIDCNGSKQ